MEGFSKVREGFYSGLELKGLGEQGYKYSDCALSFYF